MKVPRFKNTLHPKVIIPAAALFICALLVLGCAGSLSDPSTVSAQQTYSNASLTGAYSFNETGSNGTVTHDGSGTLQFDGNGHLTGAITDYYIGSSSCQFSITGTYTVAGSATGTASITTTSTDPSCIGASGTESLGLGQQGQSLVFAESEGQRLDTGTALKQ
jgi:hypothetical protein